MKDLEEDLKISYEELMNELDNYTFSKLIKLTAEQINFIKKAREKCVRINDMVAMWKKVWPKIPMNYGKMRYQCDIHEAKLGGGKE